MKEVWRMFMDLFRRTQPVGPVDEEPRRDVLFSEHVITSGDCWVEDPGII